MVVWIEYDGNRIILAITKSMLETKPKLSDEDKDIIENIENDIYDTISENEDIRCVWSPYKIW